MEYNIEIDPNSGFCFGVDSATKRAEEELKKGNKIYCLGQIVHNDLEVKRLEDMGMITLSYDDFKQLKNANVLLRAHGEPPETYSIAKENNTTLIDASCPIVTKFQKRIKKAHEEAKNEDQVVIYGNKSHPEVIGLAGQIEYKAIIVENEYDLEKINFDKPVQLYSQTTKSVQAYKKISVLIENKSSLKVKPENVKIKNKLCGHVSGREAKLKKFAKKHDIIIFVSGKESSNGKMLYNICKQVNENTHFISSVEELDQNWFKNKNSIGICGATSTPTWLMEQAKKEISKKLKSLNQK